MKRLITLMAGALIVANNLLAVAPPTPPQVDPVEQFRSFILDMAEKDSISGADYSNMAQQTIAIGQAAMQSGQRLPDSIIHDGLDAVDAGKAIDQFSADWTTLEKELIALLEEPPEQEQQSEDQQQDNQEQEDSQEQEQQNQEGQNSENQEQQDQQQNSESQEQQNGEQGEQDGEQGEQDEQEQQEGNPEDQQDQQSEGQNGESQEEGEEQPQQPQGGAEMGDLDETGENQELELDQQDATESQEDMQSIGGQQEGKEEVGAEKAVILQKLEQLKQQDDPAKLFQILQRAESDEDEQQQPNAKDW